MDRNLKSYFVFGLCVALIAGGVAGLGGFTFFFAKGFSYFQDNPKVCANCHVMRAQYEGWQRGSHRQVATCNNCHTPEPFLAKMLVKSLNGWNHSVAFTLGGFSDPIRIKEFNRIVTWKQCLTCHENLVSQMVPVHKNGKIDCLKCHSGVGHG